MGGVFVWVIIVGAVFGGGGYFAYSRGLLGAGSDPGTLAADSTAAGGASDSIGVPDSAAAAPRDTARVAPPPPGTPGRLVLQGVPPNARVTLNGQPVRGTQMELPPGTHRLAVRVTGYRQFERQVVITPGNPSSVTVELERLGASTGVGPCDQYGPEYNRGNLCWDTRPSPLSSTFVPVPADAPIFPRPAILLIHVSQNGETLEARIFGSSNVETFNTQALDMARALRWNPATKNGDPTDAWIQVQFVPQRQ
jgi:TonB family protein